MPCGKNSVVGDACCKARTEERASTPAASPASHCCVVLVDVEDQPVELAPDNVMLTSTTSAPTGKRTLAPVSGLAPWYSATYSVEPSLKPYACRATPDASALGARDVSRGEADISIMSSVNITAGANDLRDVVRTSTMRRRRAAEHFNDALLWASGGQTGVVTEWR